MENNKEYWQKSIDTNIDYRYHANIYPKNIHEYRKGGRLLLSGQRSIWR